MKRIALSAFLAAATMVAVVPAAFAADPLPRLRAAVTVSSDIVTVGDLFADAGKYAGIAVFRSPDPGRTGTVSAEAIANAVETAGLTAFDRAGVDIVAVTRTGRVVTEAEMTEILRTALAASLEAEPERIDIALDLSPGPLYAEPAADIRIVRLARSAAGNRFEAVLEVGQGTDAERIRVTGTATETVDIVTAVRPLDRGEVVSADDLAVTRIPARQAHAGSATTVASLVGLAARRALRAGVPLGPSDFAPPVLVNRGDVVTIVYQSRGLLLTTRGKALENGARNAAIPVANLSSNRVLTAIVTGRGAVEVVGAAPTGKLAMGAAQ
jgi:flagella basal body P-ring formation protein FlgA